MEKITITISYNRIDESYGGIEPIINVELDKDLIYDQEHRQFRFNEIDELLVSIKPDIQTMVVESIEEEKRLKKVEAKHYITSLKNKLQDFHEEKHNLFNELNTHKQKMNKLNFDIKEAKEDIKKAQIANEKFLKEENNE